MGQRDKRFWSLVASAFAAAYAFAAEGERLVLENAFLRRAFSTEGGVLRTVEIVIGIGTPLAERPSHTTDRTDRVTSGSAANDRMNREG